MNEFTNGKNCFEKALKFQQQTSSAIAFSIQVAYTLHDIGRCLIETNILINAKVYLEKALKIKQQT